MPDQLNLIFRTMKYLSILFFCLLINKLYSQPVTDPFLADIFAKNKDSVFKAVMHEPTRYRLQIIYTLIDRDKNNRPGFKNYYYNFDPALYFNPASTVKLPLAILALEKLNAIGKRQVDKYSTIQFDSSYTGQNIRYTDSTSQNGMPSIAHFIKKAFLVSDNDAYNRLYQFVGQQSINRQLKSKGYDGIRITRQFRGNTAEQNRHTNQTRFLGPNAELLYTQPPAYNSDTFNFLSVHKVGKGYLDRNDSLVNEPMDFTTHNNISLKDLQQILQSVIFPASVLNKQRFSLTDDDRHFLLKYLSQYPSETNYPKYDTSKYYDSYVKFFFRNASHQMPSNVRVFNKVGWSYGFLTDVSYIVDAKNKVEFILSATLYVNSDGILNDDRYDYNLIGYPFLYQLGQTIYQYELSRPRKYLPTFSGFNFKYEHRDPNDKRNSIREVEN